MSIVLSPDVEQQIEELVKSGQYESANAFVRASLQSLRDRESRLRERREEVQRLLDEAEDDMQKDRFTVYDDEGLKRMVEEIDREGRKRLDLPADAP